MSKLSTTLKLCTLSLLAVHCNQSSQNDYVDYVNPYMGNISHLLVPTYPTVQLPNAMLRVNPERTDFTSDLIAGLPIAVTSHRGSSTFNLSPICGHEPTQAIQYYSYDNEKITPYKFSIYLDQEDIDVQYAPSYQAATYEINFNGSKRNSIVINSRNGEMEIGESSVSGYQIIDNTPTKIYLYIEAKQKPINGGALINGGVDYKIKEGSTIALLFDSEVVNLRYGISFISVEQARRNLKRDVDSYNIDVIAARGREAWNDVLSNIKVEGGNQQRKEVFYTSLYRTYERMINISEDGKYYSSFDMQVHDDQGTPFYTDDWIWDTYRATHPLRILIEEDLELDMINSYIRMAQQSSNGWMPTFPEITGDSHRMNGNHAVAVIWDAYSKGLTGFNLEEAYKACKSAMTEKSLLPWTRVNSTALDKHYSTHGYFPALRAGDIENCPEVHPFERRQSVAIMLGHCYDAWCLAQIANQLGLSEDYKYFTEVSLTYRNIFNHETGFFHPRSVDGKFIEPFDYQNAGGQGARDYYCENNAWIYRWDVPHNITDLIDLMGGSDTFVANLNSTFQTPINKSKYDYYVHMPDHTGNVGQFSMANEPCLHIPYLYNYAGQPWMTQKRIHTLVDQWFRSDLMGVPGDEDGGGMSAFVVFSMMGFYPVTPGSESYSIGSPMFQSVTLDLGQGVEFRVVAENYHIDNKYIQSASLNGKEWNKPWFSQRDISNGGTLRLVMGNKANKQWGTTSECCNIE